MAMGIPSLQANFDPHNGGLVQFGADANLHVVFYAKSVIDPVQTKEAGRPVHVQVEYVKIQQRGERDMIDRPAYNEDKMRFRPQYQAFMDGKADVPDGTSLSVLFPNNPEVPENLKYLKVFTVEQLASLNDTQIQSIGLGGREFSVRAKNYLSASEKGKGFHELEKKLELMDLKLQEKDNRIAALELALGDDVPKKRGPKPKQKETE